ARQADLPNMIPNSAFLADTTRWSTGSWFRQVDPNVGPYLICGEPGDQYAVSDDIPATAEETYRVSFNLVSSGPVFVYFEGRHNGATIGGSLSFANYTAGDWTQRQTAPAFVLPTGASAY